MRSFGKIVATHSPNDLFLNQPEVNAITCSCCTANYDFITMENNLAHIPSNWVQISNFTSEENKKKS